LRKAGHSCREWGCRWGWAWTWLLVCDIRIASEEARFGSYFCPPRGGRNRLGRTTFCRGSSGCRERSSSPCPARLIDAAEADPNWLVSRVVPSDRLVGAVEELLERLSWGAPLAQRIIKRVMIRGLSMQWEEFDEYVRPTF